MISFWVDKANVLVAWMKKSRRIRPKASVVKVNAGSSLFVTDGWINVDGSPHVLFSRWPEGVLKLLYKVSDARNWCGEPDRYIRNLKDHVFVHHNLQYGMPFPNESVDYVYSSHVLEHLYPDAAERVIKDMHRILKSGGRLRICVPDLEYTYRLYCQGSKEKALSYFFEPRSGEFNRHRYMYDFEILSALLKRIGFQSIEKCAHQQGLVPDLDHLDNRPEETLHVECVKSGNSAA